MDTARVERQENGKAQGHKRHFARYKRKTFLHRVVTGDKKRIYFENPKRKKSWVDPGAPSTSTPRSNRFGRKIILPNLTCLFRKKSAFHTCTPRTRSATTNYL